MSVTATRHGWRVQCDWLIGCTRVTVLHNEHVDEVRDTIAERGWTRGKRDTDYCPEHSGTVDAEVVDA